MFASVSVMSALGLNARRQGYPDRATQARVTRSTSPLIAYGPQAILVSWHDGRQCNGISWSLVRFACWGRGLRAQRGVHLTLRALREGVGKTQVEVRDASRIDQADISRLEGRESFDEYQLSTLQR